MIINQEKWDHVVKKNDDPYGKCCVDIARECMRILDENKEFEPHNLITQAEKNVGEEGIIGFMAAMIAQMITQFHNRGEEFRVKWNKEWGVETAKGVVNPAILEIKDK